MSYIKINTTQIKIIRKIWIHTSFAVVKVVHNKIENTAETTLKPCSGRTDLINFHPRGANPLPQAPGVVGGQRYTHTCIHTVANTNQIQPPTGSTRSLQIDNNKFNTNSIVKHTHAGISLLLHRMNNRLYQ